MAPTTTLTIATSVPGLLVGRCPQPIPELFGVLGSASLRLLLWRTVWIRWDWVRYLNPHRPIHLAAWDTYDGFVYWINLDLSSVWRRLPATSTRTRRAARSRHPATSTRTSLA